MKITFKFLKGHEIPEPHVMRRQVEDFVFAESLKIRLVVRDAKDQFAAGL